MKHPPDKASPERFNEPSTQLPFQCDNGSEKLFHRFVISFPVFTLGFLADPFDSLLPFFFVFFQITTGQGVPLPTHTADEGLAEHRNFAEACKQGIISVYSSRFVM